MGDCRNVDFLEASGTSKPATYIGVLTSLQSGGPEPSLIREQGTDYSITTVARLGLMFGRLLLRESRSGLRELRPVNRDLLFRGGNAYSVAL
jgi:hypothetical protein